MAWPLGDLVSVVREVYDIEGSIRRTSDRLGIGIGTVQDMLVNPDRERRLGTLEAIQGFYETARPQNEPGPHGSQRFTSRYWMDSLIEDIPLPRGADAFLVNWQGTPYANSPQGWRSSGWITFNEASLDQYRYEHGIASGMIGDIRYGRGTD